jgi:menaquinone-dependent protoporphyrinogen IX oxidase
MRPVVVYQSKYGATERYARWISEALSCPCRERRNVTQGELSDYDTVLYGGGLYAGGVSGIRLLTANWETLRTKRILLFTCGLSDPADPDNAAHILDGLSKVLTSEMQEQIEFFHLRGGIDYRTLGPLHRAMMGMLYRTLKKKDPRTLRTEDLELLRTYGKRVDFTDRSAILPILSALQREK